MTKPCCEKCKSKGPFGLCLQPNYCPCHRPTSENYERDHSHVHCWEQKNPPGGQKIEHLKCCICEKKNPKATSESHQDNSGCPCYRVPWCHIEPCKGPPKVESHQECCKQCHGEFTPKYGNGSYRCLDSACPCHQAQEDGFVADIFGVLQRAKSKPAQGADWEEGIAYFKWYVDLPREQKDGMKSFIRKAIEQAREEGFQKGKEHYSSFAFEGGQQAAYQEIREVIAVEVGNYSSQKGTAIHLEAMAVLDMLNSLDAAVEKLINKTI